MTKFQTLSANNPRPRKNVIWGHICEITFATKVCAPYWGDSGSVRSGHLVCPHATGAAVSSGWGLVNPRNDEIKKSSKFPSAVRWNENLSSPSFQRSEPLCYCWLTFCVITRTINDEHPKWWCSIWHIFNRRSPAAGRCQIRSWIPFISHNRLSTA